ncbi:MAG: hypothetical protein HQL94_01360, partial [Magnetococcales bacterium]|nr:hypothetical protein [Magnetococcales bacterium]
MNRYTLFLAGLYLYLLLTDHLIELTKGVMRMEVPLLLYLYFYFNAITKESKWRPYVAATPLLVIYLVHDYYFLRFFRIPKIIDFEQLPELIGVLGIWGNLCLAGFVVLLFSLFVSFMRLSFKAFVLAIPGVIVFATPYFYPQIYIDIFSQRSIEVIHYAAVVNVEYNGRLATALYNEAKRQETFNNISSYRDINKLAMRLPAEMETPARANGKNVHMIVLEGFLDPTLLTNLPSKINPVHPDFTALVGANQGFSVSPVFGGYTSQAEFEVLCGVPAFQ